MKPSIVNIAAYKFVSLDELPERRRALKARCLELAIKGTILLSPEGVNLFLAGSRESIDALLTNLRSDPLLADLEVKESLSDRQPFNRMLVRLKKEIIAFGVAGIDPRERTAPKLAASELKRWLDEGKPVTLLDTRNDYEVQLGTFKSAVDLNIDHFRKFPAAVKQLPNELRDQPVVMFCTGGIRCEKAGPLMEREGFQQVFQLEGGILKYFEECGGDHWQGECFVFDGRVALDPNLQETATAQCFVCQRPLNEADQQSVQYLVGEHCPYCYEQFLARDQLTLVQRQAKLQAAATPLPGSAPYDNIRPTNIPERFDQATLLETLDGMHPHIGSEQWLEWFDLCRITFQDQPVGPDHRVRAGERYERLIPAMVEPDVNAAIRLLHEDEALVVLDKPAPLPMHPGGRFNRNTLHHLLTEAYLPQRLRAVHRLDANTTGVVVLARTKAFARALQRQFTEQQVKKTYLVRVHGHIAEEAFESTTPISREPTQAGLRLPDADGHSARTEFRVLKRHGDGTTLLEAKPLTGRTNQIRIHLWERGHAVCGDPAYLPDGKLGKTQTRAVGDPPLCLHARALRFNHPLSGEPFEIETELPPWYESTSS